MDDAYIDIPFHTGDTILMVAHASSLDSCTRLLIGKPARNYPDMAHVCVQVPYCGVVKLSHDRHAWRLSEPEFGSSIFHDGNESFSANATLSQ